MHDQHTTDVAASAGRDTSIAVALTIMLLAQAALAFASLTVPVMATLVAVDTGLPVVWVGYYSAIITLGAMVAAIFGAPLVDRLGPIRSSQFMLMAAAGGLLLLVLGSTMSFVFGALLIGCGYGPANSAGSNLLRRVVRAHRRSLVFSIKQISIPLGGAVAGMLIPVLAASLTWQAAAISVALVCCGLAVAIESWRDSLDAIRDTSARKPVLDPIRIVFGTPALRRLAIASAIFSAVQFSFTAFFVTYLVERLAVPIGTAGLLMSLSLSTSIATRLIWGWVADSITAIRVIGILSLGTAVVCALAPAMSSTWPVWVIGGVGIGFGVTALSWNGIYLAEIASLSPLERVSAITGGAMVFTWIGALSGPAMFSLLLSVTGGFKAGFLVLSGLAFGSSVLIFLNTHRAKYRPPDVATRSGSDSV